MIKGIVSGFILFILTGYIYLFVEKENVVPLFFSGVFFGVFVMSILDTWFFNQIKKEIKEKFGE